MNESRLIFFGGRRWGKTWMHHTFIYLDETQPSELRNKSGQWFIDHKFLTINGENIRTDFK